MQREFLHALDSIVVLCTSQHKYGVPEPQDKALSASSPLNFTSLKSRNGAAMGTVISISSSLQRKINEPVLRTPASFTTRSSTDGQASLALDNEMEEELLSSWRLQAL
ncbi:hypothetical protein IF1G_02893 [Cordyceps javanica]|uniref:Uncharacterized protein n=1 Tax=Cordyceps javanica TaxID=43265 RepID=A0A545VAS7_9HYPO|nr:hypothetical protein IF1G_02893 [Cordyceps javanica]